MKSFDKAFNAMHQDDQQLANQMKLVSWAINNYASMQITRNADGTAKYIDIDADIGDTSYVLVRYRQPGNHFYLYLFNSYERYFLRYEVKQFVFKQFSLKCE